jgi:hypothetical protein
MRAQPTERGEMSHDAISTAEARSFWSPVDAEDAVM